ncbi:hypothetical protein [Rathayibacter sp. AY1D9]|uniref:hypothetical protein n=1 Tax=Rathayibacter sp. AY1D9 TaxID=2080548 RepID=UPI000CE915DE|nr:hypothetical protein [Rathayibacter sp. AY1D9]PPH84878.1 hypothetical protein C5C50_00890 [Rathayibacter sp. AY1D9]
MQRGEVWAYRETPKKRPVAARILSIGTNAGAPKAKIELLDDRFEGLQRWVTRRKLLAPWPEIDEFLEREKLEDSIWVRRTSLIEDITLATAMSGMPEHIAEERSPVGVIRDEAEFERITGISASLVVDGLPHYRDDEGLHMSIDGVYRMAQAVAKARPAKVLAKAAQMEAEALEECTYGRTADSLYYPGETVHIPAERLREVYREETQPMIAQLRDWCGYEPDGSKRETVEDRLQRQLDSAVAVGERAIAYLRHHGRKHDADALSRELRDALGIERLSQRKGRGKGWFDGS